MSLPHLRVATACAFAVATLAPAAHAQPSAHPSQLRIELVIGLLGGVAAPSTPGTTYFADSLPTGWPPALLLASARLLGGMRSDARIVVVYADTSRTAMEDYRALLLSNGFVPVRMADVHGFTSEEPAHDAFCRGAARVRPVLSTWSGRRVLSVAFESGAGEQCGDAGLASTLSVPALVPPPTATVIDMGTSVATREARSQTRLASMLPPQVLLGGYITQLAAARWMMGTPAFSNTIAAVALDARDPAGRAWYGSLVITSSGDYRDVQLLMRSADRF